MNPPLAEISWQEQGQTHQAFWYSENGMSPPKKIVIADDTLKADQAYRYACEGCAMLWRGDFFNARQLLQAINRRLTHKPSQTAETPAQAFHLNRKEQVHRTRILGLLLVELEPDFSLKLRRAPDVRAACGDVLPNTQQATLISLRALNGLIGAHQWRDKGVMIPELNETIHPHFGVFSPVRGEYLSLIAEAPLPSLNTAFDIGTGTGVISALLAKRGIKHIIGTDIDPRALACAQENLSRLNLNTPIELQQTDMFPTGSADLIICNPPWLPASVNTPIEKAIYDPDHTMLKTFLNGVSTHLNTQGEAWLIMSDLAEHLGLRKREDLKNWIEQAGLQVIQQHTTRPSHKKSQNEHDPLAFARQKETTSLWRLRPKK